MYLYSFFAEQFINIIKNFNVKLTYFNKLRKYIKIHKDIPNFISFHF